MNYRIRLLNMSRSAERKKTDGTGLGLFISGQVPDIKVKIFVVCGKASLKIR
jgi:hypothetical protein